MFWGLPSWDLRHGVMTVFTSLKANLPSALIIYG